MRCERSNIPETGTFTQALWIGNEFEIECQRSFGVWKLVPVNSPPAGVTFTPLTKEDCNLPEKGNTMTVNFNITRGLENLNITCFDFRTGELSNSFLLINETKCE